MLDAFVEFKWNDYFHIRAGRHLPASDRYNLDGPYYQNSFNFPLVSQRWPNVALGRVDGASFWGQYAGGKFKWQGTVSEGSEIAEGANDDADHVAAFRSSDLQFLGAGIRLLQQQHLLR